MPVDSRRGRRPPFADSLDEPVAALGEIWPNGDGMTRSLGLFHDRLRADSTLGGPATERGSNHASPALFFHPHGSRVGTEADDGATSGGWNASHVIAFRDHGGFGGTDGAQVRPTAVNGGGSEPACSFLVRFVTGGVDVGPSSDRGSGLRSLARRSS